jgi:hypothetical protein
MLSVNFASIDAQSFQKPNPGGVRRVFCILSNRIIGNWPLATDIVNGRIVRPPVMLVDNVWAEYKFPDGTASFDSDFGGDSSYESWKQMIEVSLAGHSDTVRQEVAKHLNAGSLWVMEDKDGDYNVIGSSDDPLFLKGGFKGGKKGNDKRGYALKGEVDGMSWDVTPLKSDCVLYLTAVRYFGPEWEYFFH